MQTQLILVLGVLLAGSLPASGQSLTARLDLAQTRPAPGLTLVASSSAGFPLTTDMPARARKERPVRLPTALAVVEYRKPSLKLSSKVQVEQIQTPFIRQARISLVQMWGGRMRLDGIASAMSMKNVLDGPLNSVHPGTMQPRNAALYGISLSVRFGRNASL